MGKISHLYRQFFMGHKGDMEARYTTNKGRLPNELIEDMRKSFEKCDDYLSTTPHKGTVDVEKMKIDVLLTVAEAQGYKKETVNAIREAVTKGEASTADKVMQMLKDKAADLSTSFYVRPSKKKEPPSNGKPYQGMIISEDEMLTYVEDGWEIVRELKGGKFLVKRPNHVQH
jgi:hypothetical protein